MKIVISEQQLRRIISEETSSTIIVSSGFTASNCDELHAFQETKEEINGKHRQFHWIDTIRLKTKGTPFNERIWLIRKEINDFFSTLY